MLKIGVLIVTLLFAAPAFAQSAHAARNASGVEIDSVWFRDTSSAPDPNAQLSDPNYLVRNPSPRFEVCNRGPKPVKAIAFDYVFLDWDKQTELKRLPQRLKARIEPGGSFSFRKRHGGRMRSGNYVVEIKKVEYGDGSVWVQ